MKKTIIIVIAVMLVVLVGVIVGKSISGVNTSNTVSSEKIDNSLYSVSNNNVDKKAENEKSNTVNNVLNTVDNTENKEEKTDLDKAMDLVKKDWGEDSTVYFAQDGKTENGEIIICVRDNKTTGARAWYSVDVTAGTAEKWE